MKIFRKTDERSRATIAKAERLKNVSQRKV